MEENKRETVYVVTSGIVHNFPNGNQSTDYDVLGTSKDLKKAIQMAWKEIEENLSAYDDAPSYEITYKRPADWINRQLENLGKAFYGNVKVFNGNTVALFVQMYKTELT